MPACRPWITFIIHNHNRGQKEGKSDQVDHVMPGTQCPWVTEAVDRVFLTSSKVLILKDRRGLIYNLLFLNLKSSSLDVKVLKNFDPHTK